MVRGSGVIMLGLCLTMALTLKAGAQQGPPGNDPQVMQLKQEIGGIQQQLKPLRAQMLQLLAQIKALKEQIRPLEDDLKADQQKMRALLAGH